MFEDEIELKKEKSQSILAAESSLNDKGSSRRDTSFFMDEETKDEIVLLKPTIKSYTNKSKFYPSSKKC